jgi:hypothetical protein
VELVFIRRIENRPEHIIGCGARIANAPKTILKATLASLDDELCAGQVPTDFKARIDNAYQEATSECNDIYELS